jgi:hypothetical protein
VLTGKGIDHQMRRAHQARRHGSGSLERQQFVHQGGVDPRAELGQHLGQHEMPLGALHLHLPNPARIHYRQVGAQLATDLFIGTVQLMFE